MFTHIFWAAESANDLGFFSVMHQCPATQKIGCASEKPVSKKNLNFTGKLGEKLKLFSDSAPKIALERATESSALFFRCVIWKFKASQ